MGVQRYTYLLGDTGVEAGKQVVCDNLGIHLVPAFESVFLDYWRGGQTYLWRDKVSRYEEAHQRRRPSAGKQLTVRRESVGSKQG